MMILLIVQHKSDGGKDMLIVPCLLDDKENTLIVLHILYDLLIVLHILQLLSKETAVQGDCYPIELVFKEAFTTLKSLLKLIFLNEKEL